MFTESMTEDELSNPALFKVLPICNKLEDFSSRNFSIKDQELGLHVRSDCPNLASGIYLQISEKGLLALALI